jgi:PAS domain S-box-containing protein
MPKKSMETTQQAQLRLKAVSQLGGPRESEVASRSAPPAYQVLHKLASSPSTAVDALALLHELQVHQVELELQADEMRSSYVELEAILHRQRQLYESAPVGCFTVDSNTTIVELNSPGAQLLGSARDELLGHVLHGFLTPDGARRLQAHIRCVGAGQQVDADTLQLLPRDGKSRLVHATVRADPAGNNCLVVFMDAGAHQSTPGSPLR